MKSEKHSKLAEKILKIQLAVGYLIYFIVVGTVTVNMFFMSNWWARLVPPEAYPIPVSVQNAVGVILLIALILLQTAFLASLYLLKKEKERSATQSQRTTRPGPYRAAIILYSFRILSQANKYQKALFFKTFST